MANHGRVVGRAAALTEFRANFGTVPNPGFPQADPDGWLAVLAVDELAARRALAVALGGLYSSIYRPEQSDYPRGDHPTWPYWLGELGRMLVLSSGDDEPRWEWLSGGPS